MTADEEGRVEAGDRSAWVADPRTEAFAAAHHDPLLTAHAASVPTDPCEVARLLAEPSEALPQPEADEAAAVLGRLRAELLVAERDLAELRASESHRIGSTLAGAVRTVRRWGSS
jgi:hypothetical protein